jgi:hypothetical protein
MMVVVVVVVVVFVVIIIVIVTVVIVVIIITTITEMWPVMFVVVIAVAIINMVTEQIMFISTGHSHLGHSHFVATVTIVVVCGSSDGYHRHTHHHPLASLLFSPFFFQCMELPHVFFYVKFGINII